MEIVPSWMPAPAVGKNKSTCSTPVSAFSEAFSYVNACISEGWDKETRLVRNTSELVKIVVWFWEERELSILMLDKEEFEVSEEKFLSYSFTRISQFFHKLDCFRFSLQVNRNVKQIYWILFFPLQRYSLQGLELQIRDKVEKGYVNWGTLHQWALMSKFS